jgi:uncharacterized Fe-S cluster-containing radical SAM superfamily protein
MGKHLPYSASVAKLGEKSLRQILEGPEWQQIRSELADHKVPEGCTDCIERERKVGWSERITIEQRRSPNWERGITYFELDSSNLCNLQCRHCSSYFSSRWAKHEERMGRSQAKVILPDSEMLLANLRELDLRWVDTVSLKGGEPMLNSDTLALMRHLDEIGVIGNVHFYMVTNGIVINPEVIELLRKGKHFTVSVSVDGFGAVQTYIRHGGSENEKIERSIATYAEMPNTTITRNTSVMAYNVFSLDRIDAWWDSLPQRFPGKYAKMHYGLFVLDPEHMSVPVLQDHTRAALRDHYQKLDPVRYGPVIRALELPFAGVELHDKFVERTRRLDRELGRSVLEAIPELAEEMVLLSEAGGKSPPESVVEAALTKIWHALEAGDLPAARTLVDEATGWLATNLRRDLRVQQRTAQGAFTLLNGQPAAGLVFLDEAQSLMPTHAGIRMHRARLLEALGRREEAVAEARVAALDPHLASAAGDLLARCSR